jgi:hypothetical protein
MRQSLGVPQSGPLSKVLADSIALASYPSFPVGWAAMKNGLPPSFDIRVGPRRLAMPR